MPFAGGMDIILSIPNRFQFHSRDNQSIQTSIVFYLRSENGPVAVVCRQHSSSQLVCVSGISTKA